MKTRTKRIVSAAVLIALILMIPALRALIRAVDRKGLEPARVITTHQAPGGEAFYQVTPGPANAWLLPCTGGYFLIDTGYPEDYDRFVAGLELAGISIDEIRYLFITHAHDEHAGFAARLKEETGCTLIIPRQSLEDLASGRFDWQGVSVNVFVEAAGRLYNIVKRRDFSFEPVIPADDDIILDETKTDIPRSWGVAGTFLYTPGHSSDSWSLIMDDGRGFLGDAAMNYLNGLGAGRRPIFMEDRRTVYDSLERIKKAGVRMILSGHGSPFLAEALPIYKNTADPGPGIAGLARFCILLIPGLLLFSILLLFLRHASRSIRLWLYILAFILIRDSMTPTGLWSIGADPVFWLRFAADGVLLLILAAGSLVMSLAIMAFERGKGPSPAWFTTGRFSAVGMGVAGALAAAGPVLLFRIGILPGELGGPFPLALAPALLAVTLAGNLLEELLFRGYLYDELVNQGLSGLGAAVASGVAFGFCHVFLAFTVTSVGVPLLLFAVWEGILCGLLRCRYGLFSAVIAHGLGVAFIALF